MLLSSGRHSPARFKTTRKKTLTVASSKKATPTAAILASHKAARTLMPLFHIRLLGWTSKHSWFQQPWLKSPNLASRRQSRRWAKSRPKPLCSAYSVLSKSKLPFLRRSTSSSSGPITASNRSTTVNNLPPFWWTKPSWERPRHEALQRLWFYSGPADRWNRMRPFWHAAWLQCWLARWKTSRWFLSPASAKLWLYWRPRCNPAIKPASRPSIRAQQLILSCSRSVVHRSKLALPRKRQRSCSCI